jgi:ParB/RepB/Spo0J family partition protein
VTKPQPGEQVLEIPIRDIQRDADMNVRAVNSHTEDIQELAESVRQQGILEPLVVTKNAGNGYNLVFGFRRVAAAELAKLLTVPAIVRNLKPEQVREAQLVENLQRQDLNPIDEAKALKAALESTELTQAELGKKIGKSQPYVANRLRLLEVPEKAAQLLEQGKISSAVAQQILRVPAEEKGARNAIVRKIEETLQYRGVVGDRDLRFAVDSAVEGVRNRKAKAKAQATLKVPTCPKKDCGKPGNLRDFRWNPTSRELTCSNGHSWSGTTGKITDDGSRTNRYSPPPPPTLPKVDGDVPTTLTVAQVARRLLDSIKDVAEIQLAWQHGTVAELQLVVDLPDAKRLRIPDLEFRGGHKFVSLPDAEYHQRTDADIQRVGADRSNLEAWLATFGRKKGAA